MVGSFLKVEEIIKLSAELETVNADQFAAIVSPKDVNAVPNKLKQVRYQLQNCPAVARLAIARRMLHDISKGQNRCAILLYCLAASLPNGAFQASPNLVNIPAKSVEDYVGNMLILRDARWSNRTDKAGLCRELIEACLYFVDHACMTGHLPKDWPVNPETYKKLVPNRMSADDMTFAAAAYINGFRPDEAGSTMRKVTGLQPSAVSPLTPVILKFLQARSQGREF